MSIRTLATAAFIAGLTLTVAHDAIPALGAQDAKPAQPDAKAEKSPKLADLLARRISLEKPFEGKFKDAIEFLAEKYSLPIVLDPALRDFAGAGMACDGLEDKPIKLPKMMNVRTDTLLRLTCEQADAMFLIYPDYIRIVPTIFGLYETGVTAAGLDPNDDQPSPLTADQLLKTRPLTKRAIVNLTFKGSPVADVLDEIASASGANVVLAPLVAEKAAAKLTGRFANTPVDAAVRTVCEMADLGLIEDANVLIVTTRERAAARAKADQEKKQARLLSLTAANFGLGGSNPVFLPNWLGGASPSDLTTELTKLKEQNDQLKKQLDEVMKLLKK